MERIMPTGETQHTPEARASRHLSPVRNGVQAVRKEVEDLSHTPRLPGIACESATILFDGEVLRELDEHPEIVERLKAIAIEDSRLAKRIASGGEGQMDLSDKIARNVRETSTALGRNPTYAPLAALLRQHDDVRRKMRSIGHGGPMTVIRKSGLIAAQDMLDEGIIDGLLDNPDLLADLETIRTKMEQNATSALRITHNTLIQDYDENRIAYNPDIKARAETVRRDRVELAASYRELAASLARFPADHADAPAAIRAIVTGLSDACTAEAGAWENFDQSRDVTAWKHVADIDNNLDAPRWIAPIPSQIEVWERAWNRHNRKPDNDRPSIPRVADLDIHASSSQRAVDNCS